MVVGDKIEVYIPWEKAYGAHGSPPKIPAYASSVIFLILSLVLDHCSLPFDSFQPPFCRLVFTVELLGINGQKSDL